MGGRQGTTIKAHWLLLIFYEDPPHAVLRTKLNLGCFRFRKAHDPHVIVVFQTFPHMTLLLLLLLISYTETSKNMHQACWFLAVLLAFGCTSAPCRAGPLHAQCKVEWYLFFFTYVQLMTYHTAL